LRSGSAPIAGANMNAKDFIELLRRLPKGSKVTMQRKEFETLFRDSDRDNGQRQSRA